MDTVIRTERQNSRPTIGFLNNNLWHKNAYSIWHGVVDVAHAQNANLICFVGEAINSPHQFEAQANVVYELVHPDIVDGLVISAGAIGAQVHSTDIINEFCDRYRHLPVVTLEVGPVDVPCILPDFDNGMRNLITHLIQDHGYRRISYIRGPENNPIAEARYQAYVNVLAEHNIP